MKYNLDDYVGVKLTKRGREIYKEFYDNLVKDMSDDAKKRILNYEPLKDDEGYLKLQLWELMNIFGRNLITGAETPFEEKEIKLYDEKLEKEEESARKR